jgi:hypothetical protein
MSCFLHRNKGPDGTRRRTEKRGWCMLMGNRMEMEIHAATLPKENEKLTNAGKVRDRGWRW